MDLQYWPGETVVGHQSFAGARLRFIQEDVVNRVPARLGFEFARIPHDAVIRQTLPPTQILRSPIDLNPHTPTKPSELIETSNRFLRENHPEIDLPNALLLEHLLEDQDLCDNSEPLQSCLLTGLSIDEHHAAILSVGGSMGTELHCSLLASHQSNPRRLHRNPKPATSLRTPVKQLANGPSLNLAGQAVFLARTHDSTSFFTYSPPDSSDFSNMDPSLEPSCPSFDFETSYQLSTSDTNHEIHVDSCVGHTINDHLHQFITLNAKGQLWKVSGIGGHSGSIKQVGQINHDEPGNIGWARCGIYPTNDCLVVGLRKSVNLVDHRLDGTCSQLFSVCDGQQITDLQRYNNNRSPHLRLITTTSSIEWIDDRKPQVPIITVKHFRAPDLTLSMSFSAEPAWSPHTSFSLSTAGERFDKLLLWSRVNDVASVHQFQSYAAIPPVVLGHGVNVPVMSCKPSNHRSGLLFFRHQVFNGDDQKVSLIEMKRDGSVWHQQLNLSDCRSDAALANTMIGDQVHPSVEMVPTDDAADKVDSIAKLNGNFEFAHLELDLDTICDDFIQVCLEKSPSDEISTKASSSIPPQFFDPLYFSKVPQSLDTSNKGVPSPISVRDTIIDLAPVFKCLLPGSVNLCQDDRGNMLGDDEERLERRLDLLLSEAMKLSMKVEHSNSKSGDQESETEEANQSNSVAVDYLIDEWKLGEPTNEYKWIDICSINGDEITKNQSSSQPQSRAGSDEPSHGRTRSSRETTIDVSKNSEPRQKNGRNALVTPKTNQGTRKSPRNHPFPFNLSSSPDLASPFNPFNNVLISSNSQPIPQKKHLNPSSDHNQAFSQLVPGPHATRNSVNSISKKKRRVGGF